MPDGMSYLPAMSRLFGEVEQPTNTQAYGQQFGGNPQQLMQLLQSPAFQRQFQQAGINFDPAAVRQSPFFPNQFMQQHPHLGGALSGAMANAAMTPEAPEVSGAGSGISRAFQGMMGGPEMQRQYQVRQMMAPMQGLGMTMPYAEFQRKQQLMDLLTKMEEDRQGLAQRGQDIKASQPIRTPYGIINPGMPTDPQLVGQPQRAGSTPIQGNMFQGQGQQAFPAMMAPSFTPYDPKMLRQQTDALKPQLGAQARNLDAKTAEQQQETKGGMAGAKVDTQKSIAERNRAQGKLAGSRATDIDKFGGPAQQRAGRGGKALDPTKISKQYNDAQEKYKADMANYAAALTAKKLTPEQYKEAITNALMTLQMSKANIDQAQGNPGASARGQQQMQSQQPTENLNNHPELQGQAPGWYKDNQTGKAIQWDGKQVVNQQ